jgi:hypothetical protein
MIRTTAQAGAVIPEDRVIFYIGVKISPTKFSDRVSGQPSGGPRIVGAIVGQIKTTIPMIKHARITEVG